MSCGSVGIVDGHAGKRSCEERKMEISLLSAKGDPVEVGSQIPAAWFVSLAPKNRMLLAAAQVTGGSVVLLAPESYVVARREYPLCGLYAIKAIATDLGVVPILRLAARKERTVTQRVTKDRFGQITTSGPENKLWPVIERISPQPLSDLVLECEGKQADEDFESLEEEQDE